MIRRNWIFALIMVVALLASSVWSMAASTRLPRSTPAGHQMDGTAIEAALGAAADLGFVLGMVVTRDGEVVGDASFIGPDTALRQSRSATKSVCSTLIGIAIEQGYINGVQDLMMDYLPPGLRPADSLKQQITIGHLLTMTSGLRWDEDADVEDWILGADPVADILSRRMAAAPGTRFNYNTAASHLLSVILTEATGMSTLEFADANLFGPLGITERTWMVTGGYANGGHGLYLSTEDLAKIGILFVNDGRWQGRQLISRYWTNRATMPDVRNIGPFGPLQDIHYGWLWWLDRGTDYEIHTAWGWGGQFIFCVPELKLVVAAHCISSVSGAQANVQEAAVLSIIVDQILPAVTDRRVFRTTGREVPELAAVDDMVQQTMVENRISRTTAALVKDGRLVLARGYSWDEPEVAATSPTALFRIGSISKAITSLRTHQMMSLGLLDHETLVSELLDIAPFDGSEPDPLLAEVTVDHLLTHTSGMYSHDNVYVIDQVAADALGVERPCTRDEILSYIHSQPFIFDSGSNWDYNNYGYMMLGALSEALLGEDYATGVQRDIFRAAGVGRARIPHTLEIELAPTEVDYHGLEGGSYLVPLEQVVSAGGWVMAAPDLARVFSALFDRADGEALLSSAWRQEMFELPFPVCEELGYGRGWFTEELFHNSGHDGGWLTDPGDGLDIHSHTGGGTGVQTIALWRSDNLVFVMLSNKDPSYNDIPFPEIQSWPSHNLWKEMGISDTAAPPVATEAWIPVVARAEGVAGSQWRSDVGLLNRSSLSNEVRLRLYQEDSYSDFELELAPDEQRLLSDVLEDFELTGSGPLRVFSSEPLSLSSRTYNQSADGTFGQYLAAISQGESLATGDRAVLMQLAENEAARSNIGLLNGWKRVAEVRITLYDGSGQLVASIDQEIPPETTLQLNRPFAQIGQRSDISSGYAIVDVLFGYEVVAYASVVDNFTNDPITIPMASALGASEHWIPAVAHAAGVAGSQWRSDVAVLNLETVDSELNFNFTADDGSVYSHSLTLAPGAQVVISDVVPVLGGDGAGSLRLVADTPVLMSSRSYNQGEAGSFGQFLAAARADDLPAEGDTRVLLHLVQNTGFRTNIGLVNTSSAEANVRLRLFDRSGELVWAPTRRLDPGQRIQLQEPFAAAGREDIDAGYAIVEQREGAGVLVYGSVIDNQSNDPTTIPALR